MTIGPLSSPTPRALLSANPAPAEAPRDSFSETPLGDALERERERLERARREAERAAREKERAEKEAARAEKEAARRLRDQAEENSIALEALNETPEVRELAAFLGAYEDRLNKEHRIFEHAHHMFVPLSDKHVVVGGDGSDYNYEGWLRLDSNGICLMRVEEYSMGEEGFEHRGLVSVRPSLPVRLYDRLTGSHDREVLGLVDVGQIERRIHEAAREAEAVYVPNMALPTLPAPDRSDAAHTPTHAVWDESLSHGRPERFKL